MDNFSIRSVFTHSTITILATGLCLAGVVLYTNYRYDAISAEIENSNNLSAATEQKLDAKIKELGAILLSTLTEEQQKNSDLKDQLEQITDTVDDLEKLSNTDPELLKKYSKVYFLNEHYVPVSLEDIDEEFVNEKGVNLQIHSEVAPYLEDLLEEAKDDGMSLQALSAYRSFTTQSSLKASYTFTYGVGANRFSADQGYSEHQLGTTVDFTTVALGGALEGFDKTPEYKWLQDNAHKHGFILSYPPGNAYYKFEPWHWRFVGVSLARKLDRDNIYFYDMDQRLIDNYLIKIFD